MTINTNIQWTDHTINFWTGCKKVSEGCKNCYMYRDMNRFKKDPEQITPISEKTIKKHLKSAKPGEKIFVNSFSDIFMDEIHSELRNHAFDVIRNHPEFHFQLLTKRPENFEKFLPDDWGTGWKNVWLGVSCENEKQFRVRSQVLCETPAHIRFISAEPLLEYFDMTNLFKSYYNGIDWVILGGESGNNTGLFRYRECQPTWLLDMINDCRKEGVPVFLKQFGTFVSKTHGWKDRHGGTVGEWVDVGVFDSSEIRMFPKKYEKRRIK